MCVCVWSRERSVRPHTALVSSAHVSPVGDSHLGRQQRHALSHTRFHPACSEQRAHLRVAYLVQQSSGSVYLCIEERCFFWVGKPSSLTPSSQPLHSANTTHHSRGIIDFHSRRRRRTAGASRRRRPHLCCSCSSTWNSPCSSPCASTQRRSQDRRELYSAV